MCHDYSPTGRNHSWETTIEEQRNTNIHLHDGISEDGFIEMRNRRYAGLKRPALIIPSIQVNIRAGNLPEPADNGVRYLKIPLNTL